MNNKRIAKNTLMLYIRMLLIMTVNLYTSRVVLNELGVEDYGLYSVVGGVVVFLGFLNGSMSAATQRFLSYSKGQCNTYEVNRMFNSVFVAQFIIAVIVFILGEICGTWYISNYLNIVSDKISSAHFVFQFSLFSFVVKTLSVPYNASIIANERMDVYAKLSIVEVCLQLCMALSLTFIEVEKLILYSAMMFVVVLVTQLCYRQYCVVKFEECALKKNWKIDFIKEIFAYSGWNLMGSLSSVAIDQGVNIILNSFFGVVVNAARGVAFQVNGAIVSLSSNFQQALNPQIVKLYASKDYYNMHNLIMTGTRLSFYLLLVMALPIIFNMNSLLYMWLGVVPEYTESFCILVLINALISTFSGPLLMGAMATGRIKKYQIIVASINLINFPASLIALKLYPNPYLTVYIMIFLSIIAFVVRLVLVGKMIAMSKVSFCKKVILPMLLTSITAIMLLCVITGNLKRNEDVFSTLISVAMCFFVTMFCILVIGITRKERNLGIAFVKNRILHVI